MVYVLILLGVFEVLVAGKVAARYQRTPSISGLIGVLLGFALMSICIALVMNSTDSQTQLLLGRAAFYAGCLTFSSLLKLAIFYPIQSTISKKVSTWLFWVPLVVFLPILVTPVFVENIELVDGLPQPIVGFLFPLFGLFALAYLLAGIMIMIRKLSHVSSEQRQQALTFTALLTVTGCVGIIVNFVFPALGVAVNTSLGLITAGVLVLFIASVVMKR